MLYRWASFGPAAVGCLRVRLCLVEEIWGPLSSLSRMLVGGGKSIILLFRGEIVHEGEKKGTMTLRHTETYDLLVRSVLVEGYIPDCEGM
jgi:hypothetical protein